MRQSEVVVTGFERRQTGVSLRRYTESDLHGLCGLDEVCFGPSFRFNKGSMRRFVERPGAVVVVAETAENELAGFLIVHMELTGRVVFGYVVTVDVAEEWRRHGVASELMDEGERRARKAGAEVMDLHVWTENEGAIRFYEGRGYELMGVRKGFYGRVGLDAFVYRKILA
jgi:ribosomal-protein-alanine N-acetyltransferase